MSDSDQNQGTRHLVNGSESRCSDREQAKDGSAPGRLILMVGPDAQTAMIGGLPVIRVERLAEAQSFLDQNEATAIVIDLDLPDSSGISTLQRLLDRPGLPPVVVLVGEPPDNHDVALKALKTGASAYLPRHEAKPGVLGPLVESVMVTTRSSADLERNEARLRVAVDGAGDGLWEWDFRTGDVYFSPRCSAILGFSAEEATETPNRWLDRVHPDDLKFLHARLDAHIEGARGTFECEHRLVNGFGDPHWILARGRAVRDLEGRVTSIAGFLMDTTDRRRQEEQAIHRSLHDELTGLANRGLFIDRVERALSIPDRDGGGDLSVLFIDLDHFKQVNDLYGHGAGDRVLIEVGRRLESVLRPGDTVARLGGDEFGILLDNVQGVDLAIHIAERILNLLSQPVAVGRNEMVVYASIGIATSENRYEDAASIIDDADLAMYRAKSLGRSRYQVCNPTMHQRAMSRINLETDLRQAIDDDQFEMHYQPIVDLNSGRVAGVEAMVRWHHPERGLLTPSQFIEVAETSGLIIPLGWQVLEDACKQVGSWRRDLPEARDLFLSVNLSPRILMADGMHGRVEETLEGAGLPASALVLEFPEAVILDHGARAQEPLENLRAMGVRLAIDDFGLEHGSISQLDRKIFDTLKLDPTITERVNGVSSGDRLPPSLIGMAAQLGIEVVAEGVETGEQLEALCGLGCRMAQGFWFASATKPETVEDAIIEPPQWWTNPRGVWKSWQQY
ncbi:MAG: EAL domain-containing protein [Acidobacteriota bacterium]